MSMLERWRKSSGERESRLRLWVLYGRDTARYIFADCIPDDEAVEIRSPLAVHYLNELTLRGQVEQSGETYSLSWDVIYHLLADKEHAQGITVLELPPVGDLKPALRSENTLDDDDFAIGIDGWFVNGVVLGAVELAGPVAREGASRTLLSKEVFAVLRAVQDFYADGQRSPQSNRRHWGKVRQLAMVAGARMDQFLNDTIVLTPEKLHVQLNKTDVDGTGVVEVQPWFAGAPDNWLRQFDTRSDVPETYRILREDQLIEVVLTPPVRSVLRAIKKMPGRRVAGVFAEKFLSNPYATLGEDADLVIDEEQFDEARCEAGIVFQCFTAHWQLCDSDIVQAGVTITTADSHSPARRVRGI